MVWGDLTEDFQALASMHITTIENLLEEFNDQLLLMLGNKHAFKEAALGQMDEAEKMEAPSPLQEQEALTPLAMRVATKHQPDISAELTP